MTIFKYIEFDPSTVLHKPYSPFQKSLLLTRGGIEVRGSQASVMASET